METKDILANYNGNISDSSLSYIVKPVQVESSFHGGLKGWTYFLSKNCHVPDDVVNNYSNFKGEAILKFTVELDGTIHDILLVKSMLYLMDDMFLDILNKSPKWQPATIDGVPTKSFKKQPFNLAMN